LDTEELSGGCGGWTPGPGVQPQNFLVVQPPISPLATLSLVVSCTYLTFLAVLLRQDLPGTGICSFELQARRAQKRKSGSLTDSLEGWPLVVSCTYLTLLAVLLRPDFTGIGICSFELRARRAQKQKSSSLTDSLESWPLVVSCTYLTLRVVSPTRTPELFLTDRDSSQRILNIIFLAAPHGVYFDILKRI